jgi:RNA polymerase sigma-70 factor (sigma-E family)
MKASGPSADFNECFDSLWAVSYQVAFKILGDREEAADVAQDALLKTAVRWGRVHTYPVAFAARVAGHRAIDLRRRSIRKPDVGPIPPADHTTVEERNELVTALRRLSRRQQQVVVLRYLADLSEADTARALGCSEGTVKQHSSRALAALRATLATTPTGA